jgi:ribonuclease HII
LALEGEAAACGFARVAGLDEVGRGALCGPVMAGAVILGESFDPAGIDDSKRLSRRQREQQAERIQRECRAWAVGSAEAEEIDRLGIVAATHLAMGRAIRGLALAPDLALVDGYAVPSLPVEQWARVKGDATSVSIAAAAIVAKVTRDALMCELDGTYPGYGLLRNMGYGSAEHRRALLHLGPSAIHRRTFCHRQLALFGASKGNDAAR